MLSHIEYTAGAIHHLVHTSVGTVNFIQATAFYILREVHIVSIQSQMWAYGTQQWDDP